MMGIISAIHVTTELKARGQVMRQLKIGEISRQLSADYNHLRTRDERTRQHMIRELEANEK